MSVNDFRSDLSRSAWPRHQNKSADGMGRGGATVALNVGQDANLLTVVSALAKLYKFVADCVG